MSVNGDLMRSAGVIVPLWTKWSMIWLMIWLMLATASTFGAVLATNMCLCG